MEETTPYTPESGTLTHDRREFLFDQILKDPGVYLSALGDRTSVSLSAIRYHLRVLERAGLIQSEKRRGKRRFYSTSIDPNDLKRTVKEGPTALLIALDSLQEPSVSELAAELDRDPSTISYHLARLDNAGVITRERNGQAVVNRLTPAAKEVLTDDHSPSPPHPAMPTA